MSLSEIHLKSRKKLQKIYGFYSPVYDIIFNKVMEEGRRVAVELLDVRPGDRVLDVGTGTGLNLPYFERNIEIDGIDISAGMLSKARKRAQKLRYPNARFLQMDALAMDFEDNLFDCCLVAYTLSTIPEPMRMLQEIRRVCKPDARIVIVNHFRSHHPMVQKIERSMAKLCKNLGWEMETPLEVIEEAELHAVNSSAVNFLPLWRAVLCYNRPPREGSLARVTPPVRRSA